MKLRNMHPALKEKRTIHVKTVRQPSDVTKLLKPVSTNSKLGDGGKVIRKGEWKGLPMYSLTLQERATCPATCERWAECFGNNMPFAHRVDHTSKLFLPLLHLELTELSIKYPQGFVVRLHVLGDFYSMKYVQFWRDALNLFPMLRVFGYTHRRPNTAIGTVLRALVYDAKLGERFAVRFSDSPEERFSANVGFDNEGIVCPEQTGKTASCLTCGLCWALRDRPIAFMPH